MAVKLNLLPVGMAVPPSLAKALKLIRTLGVVALGLFLFFVLGVSGFLVYSSIKLRGLTAQSEDLKAKIKQQETTEQKMVLLKDRLGKITKVKSSVNIQKNLDNIGQIISAVPEGAALTELTLDSKKTDLALIFNSSLGLNTFLENIRTNIYFKRATLTAFSFNPQTGYSVGLRLFEN